MLELLNQVLILSAVWFGGKSLVENENCHNPIGLVLGFWFLFVVVVVVYMV